MVQVPTTKYIPVERLVAGSCAAERTLAFIERNQAKDLHVIIMHYRRMKEPWGNAMRSTCLYPRERF